jgi:hypothetical protein
VGWRTRLIKELAREHNASDPLMTRVYLRIRPVFAPAAALAFKDLDAYVATWRDALVKELREYKAAALRGGDSEGHRRLLLAPLRRGIIYRRARIFNMSVLMPNTKKNKNHDVANEVLIRLLSSRSSVQKKTKRKRARAACGAH